MTLKLRNQLIEQHLPLVHTIAKQISAHLPPVFELEDLQSAGYVGLVEAADRYNPRMKKRGHERPVPFGAFARIRIQGAILDSVRRRKYREQTSISIEDAPGSFGVWDRRVNVEQFVAERETAKVVSIAIASLPDRERTVVRALHQGRTVCSAAKEMRISAGRASQIQRKALIRLRSGLEEMGITRAA